MTRATPTSSKSRNRDRREDRRHASASRRRRARDVAARQGRARRCGCAGRSSACTPTAGRAGPARTRGIRPRGTGRDRIRVIVVPRSLGRHEQDRACHRRDRADGRRRRQAAASGQADRREALRHPQQGRDPGRAERTGPTLPRRGDYQPDLLPEGALPRRERQPAARREGRATCSCRRERPRTNS